MKPTSSFARSIRRSAVALIAVLSFTASFELRSQPDGSRALRLGIAAPAHASDALVKKAWDMFKDKVLGKVADFIKSPLESAKKGLQALIDKALAMLKKAFESDVIIPALVWALPKIFPGAQKFLDYVRQIMGSVDRLVGMAKKYTAAIDALIQKNKDKFGAAMAEVNSTQDLIEKFNVSMVVDILVAALKEKAPAFIKAKAMDLLDKAFLLIEAPIDAGKSAATAALGSIPVVGGLISGAADFVLTEGLKLLRNKGFEFIANKAVELGMKAIDAIGNKLKGLAATVDDKIQPILEMARGFMRQIEPYLAPLKAAYAKVKAGLEMANKGPGEMAAITVAKTLYGEFIGLLERNIPKAKEKLQSLADKAKAVFPGVGALLGPVLEVLAEGGASAVAEAAACKQKITGLNKEVLTAVFGCLKEALSKGIAKGGFDAFISLLKDNVPKAKEKLDWLAGKLTAVLPAAKSMVTPILAGMDEGSKTLVTKAQECRTEITGLNKASAEKVLKCLATALKSAAQDALAGAVKGLYDEFLLLLRSGCDKAVGKLGDLIGKVASVVPQVKQLSGGIVESLTGACQGGVDKIADKLPTIP